MPAVDAEMPPGVCVQNTAGPQETTETLLLDTTYLARVVYRRSEEGKI